MWRGNTRQLLQVENMKTVQFFFGVGLCKSFGCSWGLLHCRFFTQPSLGQASIVILVVSAAGEDCYCNCSCCDSLEIKKPRQSRIRYRVLGKNSNYLISERSELYCQKSPFLGLKIKLKKEQKKKKISKYLNENSLRSFIRTLKISLRCSFL